MANNKTPANDMLRSRIFAIINDLITGEDIKIGDGIKTHDIIVALKKSVGKQVNLNNRRVGKIIAECDYLSSEGYGSFRRIK